MSKLQEMVAAAKQDMELRQEQTPVTELERRIGEREAPRPFGEALSRPGLSVIAEFKRTSPSAGRIAPDADVAQQVAAYQRAGAAAVSILTDRLNFGGALTDLQAARAGSELPILRKDFILDRYQLLEAAVFGADAVLLIAAVLKDRDLFAELFEEAGSLDLDCIVEVRDSEELERALEIDADIIGINNRDLSTLEIDVNKTFDLMLRIPTGKTIVSESGIETPEQVAGLRDAGVDAILVGHKLMYAEDPASELIRLLGGEEHTAEQSFP